MSPQRWILCALSAGLVSAACQGEPALSGADEASAPITALAPSATSTADGKLQAPWCQVSGPKGSSLACELTLDGRGAAGPAAGLQFNLHWDATDLALVGVETRVCAPGGSPCADVLAPPASTFGGAGHLLVTKPSTLSTADGQATLMVYHPSNPEATLAGALGRIIFEARGDVLGAEIFVSKPMATATDAQTMPLRSAPGRLLLSP